MPACAIALKAQGWLITAILEHIQPITRPETAQAQLHEVLLAHCPRPDCVFESSAISRLVVYTGRGLYIKVTSTPRTLWKRKRVGLFFE